MFMKPKVGLKLKEEESTTSKSGRSDCQFAPANYFIFSMNDDSVYHRTDLNGKAIIAEFLIYDFRFWYDVDCYRKHAEAVHKIRNKRKKIDRYDKEQEANLLRKAEQICEHFLKSQILPQCRINVQEQDLDHNFSNQFSNYQNKISPFFQLKWNP